MSDRHDYCPKCDNQPYYDGHKEWCTQALEDRVEELEEKIETLVRQMEEHLEIYDAI